MTTTFAVLTCLFVLGLCFLASIIATVLLVQSLKRKARPLTATLTQVAQGPTSVSPGAMPIPGAMMSAQEALELRNVVLRTVSPRPEDILIWVQRRYPDASHEEQAAKIISAEAHKCGFIGFVTGVPGLIALPVTLPIDLYTTGRLQACMVEALLGLYQADLDAEEIERMRWMILLGGGSLAKSATQLLLKVFGQSVIRAIPVLGGVAGYIANYVLAQAAGRAVQAHVNGRLSDLRTGTTTQLSNAVQRVQSTKSGLAKAKTGLLAAQSSSEQLSLPTSEQAAISPLQLTLEQATQSAQDFSIIERERLELAEPAIGQTLALARGVNQASLQEGHTDSLIPCFACQYNNPGDYRFCSNCGANLSTGVGT